MLKDLVEAAERAKRVRQDRIVLLALIHRLETDGTITSAWVDGSMSAIMRSQDRDIDHLDGALGLMRALRARRPIDKTTLPIIGADQDA